MTLGFDQPWFVLLWTVALGILWLPIIVGGVNAIVNNYFQAKEKHYVKLLRGIAQIGKEWQSKKNDQEKKEGEKT